MRVLVTGATGYIGGRLIPRLLRDGHQVRVLVRDARRVESKPWVGQVEIRQGDLLDASTLDGLCDDIDAMYYLVHSMSSAGPEFEGRDRQAARNLTSVAGSLSKVIYLGGLASQGKPGTHLRSRMEVGEILRASLPTTEFRAGPIIGSGSASFEMVRYLTERLPAMFAPRWILNRVSPIGIRDVLAYLQESLELPPCGVVDIGSDPLTFREMMVGYANQRGLKRLIVPVPVLAPRLAARWVGLVTPIPNYLAVPIIAGMTSDLVADTMLAERLFPEIQPAPYAESVELAATRTRQLEVETRWSDALGTGLATDFADSEGMFRESRSLVVPAPPAKAWECITGLGGERGWLFWNSLWRVRGLLDRMAGGPGLRRGRRHPTQLATGDSLDFWRVEDFDAPRKLLLRSEMKLPGRAWMKWETQPEQDGTRISMSAYFEPKGLLGVLYWKSLTLIHRFMFTGLIKAVARNSRITIDRTPSLP